MKKSRYTEDKIIGVLKPMEASRKSGCRRFEIVKRGRPGSRREAGAASVRCPVSPTGGRDSDTLPSGSVGGTTLALPADLEVPGLTNWSPTSETEAGGCIIPYATRTRRRKSWLIGFVNSSRSATTSVTG
jgi:hypothetical protein